jgi:hypothetical protein
VQVEPTPEVPQGSPQSDMLQMQLQAMSEPPLRAQQSGI